MEQPRVLVAITSYNRNYSLMLLVEKLLDEPNVDIIIFDDKSDKPLTIGNKRVTKLTNPEHRGKAGFWRTFNDIFAYCKEHDYDY